MTKVFINYVTINKVVKGKGVHSVEIGRAMFDFARYNPVPTPVVAWEMEQLKKDFDALDLLILELLKSELL